MSLHVSEIFHSIQGEGALAGMPSTFIRLAHCNLTCSWCDAAYTWKGNVQFEGRDIADVVDECQHGHVVVTGGEPTFAEDFDELVFQLDAHGKHITVETNGTIWRPLAIPHVDLWSVSPKLGSSGQSPQIDLGVLREYKRLVGHVQWKFVIDNEDDFTAAVRLMRMIGLNGESQVFMQPNGLCHVAAVKVAGTTAMTDTGETRVLAVPSQEDRDDDVVACNVELVTPYLDRVRWLYELVTAADAAGDLPCPVRAVPQSHKLAWGNRRGF